MRYLVSELLLLFVLALALGVALGLYLAHWWRGRQRVVADAGDEGEIDAEELSGRLVTAEEELAAAKALVQRREQQLTVARRQIADVKERFKDTIGLEAELIAARETASKVPALQTRVAELEADLAAVTATSPEDELVLPPPTEAEAAAEQWARSLTTPADLGTPPAPAGRWTPPPTTEAAPWAAVTGAAEDQAADLTEVDGITPEISDLLRERGVADLQALADLSPTELMHLDHSLGQHSGQAVAGAWVGQAAQILARRRAVDW